MNGYIDGLELALVDSEKIPEAKDIDRAIQQMVNESKGNYSEMGNLVLEASAALRSADTRKRAMNERGTFKKVFDRVIGKERKLNDAIFRDQNAASYAMQQTINVILRECQMNQELAVIVAEKMDIEMTNLRGKMQSQNQNLLETRSALVAFYTQCKSKLEATDAKLDEHDSRLNVLEQNNRQKCNCCGQRISTEQVLCLSCGALQEDKLCNLPKETQGQYKKLAENYRKKPGWGELWDQEAKEIAENITWARKLVGDENIDKSLQNDIVQLVKDCKNAEFQIALVGIVKAGKSMLLNALVGRKLAPVAATSKTSAVTKFRSSDEGDYVQVSFYSKQDWEKIQQEQRNGNEEQDETGVKSTLKEQLMSQDAKRLQRKYVGRKPEKICCKDDNEIKKVLNKWVGTGELDEIFVSEVEVGLRKDTFKLPKHIVLVDTPGLSDTVQYRSQATKRYIQNADAVLIVMNSKSIGRPLLENILYIRNLKKGKIDDLFFVGAQKDLEDKDAIDELLDESSETSWIGMIADGEPRQSGDRKLGSLPVSNPDIWTKRMVKERIIMTSAKVHLLVDQASSLTPQELGELSDDDYNTMEYGARKALTSKTYAAIDLLGDSEKAREDRKKVRDWAGVDQLMNRISERLIKDQRKKKLDELQKCYQLYSKKLGQIAANRKAKAEELQKSARGGTADLISKQAEIREKERQLKAEKKHIDTEIQELRKLVRDPELYRSRI